MESRRPPSADSPSGGLSGRSAISSDEQLLRQGLDCMGLVVAPAQLGALQLYLSELLRWAPRVNLTGLKSSRAIVREGFLRSLSYRAAFEPGPGVKALDVGSGAGFPGLVLKICYPEIDMVLIEAARRRATFLRHIIRRLGLTRVHCIHARAEQLHADPGHRGQYHIAFARAVGGVACAVSLTEPLLSPGGRLILQVGRNTVESLQALRPRLAAWGMRAAVCEAPALDESAPPTQLLVVEKPPFRAA